jgi:hypothetical protein
MNNNNKRKELPKTKKLRCENELLKKLQALVQGKRKLQSASHNGINKFDLNIL